ncbi:MAG: methyltransferase domain-containing protein [Caldilineaceae bacterium]|nr:methyltransferase domain-containing protein [Caldilineaceae bacterium]
MPDSSPKATVQSQFGPNAAKYATSRVHAKGASLARLVELLQPQAEWTALDVAAAAGHTAFILAPHVAHMLVTDITPEMLDVAAGLAAEKGIDNVAFEIADAQNLPFADERFNLVTCRIAPHHFADVSRFVREAWRVLKPGGLFAVVDNIVPPGPTGDFVNEFEILRDPSHVRCLTLGEWCDELAAAGFGAITTEIAPKRMAFAPWAVRLGATPETVIALHGMLAHAPQAVLEFLQLQGEGDDLTFELSEAIVIGRKNPAA